MAAIFLCCFLLLSVVHVSSYPLCTNLSEHLFPSKVIICIFFSFFFMYFSLAEKLLWFDSMFLFCISVQGHPLRRKPL